MDQKARSTVWAGSLGLGDAKRELTPPGLVFDGGTTGAGHKYQDN
jgi:hypothetical protein